MRATRDPVHGTLLRSVLIPVALAVSLQGPAEEQPLR